MADYTFGHEVSGSLLSDVDADLRLGGLEDVNVDSTLNGRLDSAITAKSEATVEAALREAARNPQRLAEQGENVARRVRAEYSWRRTAERALSACRKANGK